MMLHRSGTSWSCTELITWRSRDIVTKSHDQRQISHDSPQGRTRTWYHYQSNSQREEKTEIEHNIFVMRKPWIGTIHGLRSSKYWSVLCAGNPWIAQHLRDPWIAQPHTRVKRSGSWSSHISVSEKPPSRTASQNRLCKRRKEQGDPAVESKEKKIVTYLSAGLG